MVLIPEAAANARDHSRRRANIICHTCLQGSSHSLALLGLLPVIPHGGFGADAAFHIRVGNNRGSSPKESRSLLLVPPRIRGSSTECNSKSRLFAYIFATGRCQVSCWTARVTAIVAPKGSAVRIDTPFDVRVFTHTRRSYRFSRFQLVLRPFCFALSSPPLLQQQPTPCREHRRTLPQTSNDSESVPVILTGNRRPRRR